MQTAVVITRNPSVVSLYHQLLKKDYHVISLSNEKDILQLTDVDKVSLIVLGTDILSRKSFDIHSFSQDWAPRATILFAAETPQLPASSSVLDLCSALGEVKRTHSIADSDTTRLSIAPPLQHLAGSSNKASPAKSRSFIEKILGFLFKQSKIKEPPVLPGQNDPPPAKTVTEPPVQEKAKLVISSIEPNPPEDVHKTSMDSRDAQPAIVSPKIIRPSTQDLTLNGFLMGPFHIVFNELIIRDWPSRKGKSLFAYLLYHHDKPCFREALMDTFWPHLQHESARNSLNVAMHGIRRLFKKTEIARDLILFKNEKYLINPEICVATDCDIFASSWKEAQRIERLEGLPRAVPAYERAAELYKGDFMANEVYKETAEEWTCLERENIKERYLFILEKLSKFHTEDGHPETAVILCSTILEHDSCREDVHRRLMLLFLKQKKRNKAIRQFHQCEEVLRAELDVEPAQATLALFEKIKGGQIIPNE